MPPGKHEAAVGRRRDCGIIRPLGPLDAVLDLIIQENISASTELPATASGVDVSERGADTTLQRFGAGLRTALETKTSSITKPSGLQPSCQGFKRIP